jgi:hypothetical protein
MATDPHGLVGVVTHHRGERLLNAWDKAGQQPDGGVDMKTFFEKGEKPATSERKLIDPHRLAAGGSLQGMISKPRDIVDRGSIKPQAGAVRT